MKKIIQYMLIVVMVFGISLKVNAEEVFYTTPNGVDLTEKEYRYLTTLFWKDYVDNMTQSQVDDFRDEGWFEGRLVTSSIEDNGNMCSINSPSHETPYKKLSISATCISECLVSLINTWKVDSVIKSWDVIGAYLSNVTLNQHDVTYVYSTSGTTSYNNLKTAYNGIGNSVKLPSSGDNIVVNMVFRTTTGGHIFGSYQHAMQNITLPVSQNYNFSLGGYGSVFSFYGNAIGKFDGMAGVDIAV